MGGYRPRTCTHFLSLALIFAAASTASRVALQLHVPPALVGSCAWDRGWMLGARITHNVHRSAVVVAADSVAEMLVSDTLLSLWWFELLQCNIVPPVWRSHLLPLTHSTCFMSISSRTNNKINTNIIVFVYVAYLL